MDFGCWFGVTNYVLSGYHALSPIIFWVVYQCGYGVRGHLIGWVGLDEWSQAFGRPRRSVQPLRISIRWQDHRHAVMQRSHQVVRRDRDDGA